MAKKKAKKAKNRSNRGGREPQFDRRTMERAMRQFGEQLFGQEDTPLARAQDLVYQAIEEPDPDRRESLAREALKISADCADAYVFLAEQTDAPDEQIELYDQAVAAGRRALGEAFRELEGEFWRRLETRPFMRAKLGLALALWDAGRREEAISHYHDMLRLNPEDNQGVRYTLADALLDSERHEELERLAEQYRDDVSAPWAYTRALLAFRQHGDSPDSRAALAAAAEANASVPEYLTGNREIPVESPSLVEPGADDEAANYAAGQLRHWRNTPGAVSWLRKTLRVGPPEQPARAPVSWQRARPRIASLPQEDEVWQVDIRHAPHFPDAAGSGRPWIVVVVHAEESGLLSVEAEHERPSPNFVWNQLVHTMLDGQGEPRRPQSVEVRLKTFYNAWRAKLEQVGVSCTLSGELPAVDEVLGQMESLSAFGGRAEGLGESVDAGPFDPQDVPQYVDSTWQVDARRLPAWVDSKGEAMRPWSVLVVETANGLILGQDLSLEMPTPQSLWNVVHGAMVQPMVGDPHRPGTIQVRSADHASALQSHLGLLDVRCEVTEELQAVDVVFEGLGEHLSEGHGLRPLVDVPGVKPEQIGGFYAAAAEFYRRAPWRMVPGDAMIRIQCDKYTNGTWYAAVMGQSGMTLGLALYEDAEVLQALMHEDMGEEEHSRRISAMSVTFDEEFAASARDLDAAEKYGWPIAGPEAYPVAMRVNPGRSVRPPLAWELELLEACLRAIPPFVAQGRKSDRRTVPTALGELELDLKRMD
ncbi:MAG: hypothetical protein HUU20_18715 [Pirellulales bacterium]|nr:hypothetical protein [Pirellulales bacterium]